MARSRKKSTWLWVAIVAVVGWFTRKMWLPKVQEMMKGKTDSTTKIG
jgi:hypothetical protein